MKYLIKIFSLVFFFLITIDVVYARRGCCSWHGGVSGACRNGKQVCNDGTTSPSCLCEGGTSNVQTYIPPTIYGCTDPNSINYNPNATSNDGSCIKKVYGCTDPNAYNYNPSANVDDASCIAKVYGCIDNKAINYNKNANTPDGSCEFKKQKISYKKIKYKTKYKYKIFAKDKKVLRKGKNGKKKITKEIIVDENNQILQSKVIKTEIIKKPINKIIATKKKNH